MANPLIRYSRLFDQRPTRERALLALALFAVLGLSWWSFLATPQSQQLAVLDQQNQQLAATNNRTRALVGEVRQRIAGGVHREKQAEYARLAEQLAALEQELRLKTIELIPPEKMFALMNQLILRDSKLTLQRLARREVRAAIPSADPAKVDDGAGIYRHVLEIEFSGRYLDILAYMRRLEALEWRLLWDEIEIRNDEYPRVDVRLVMSTLSTEKQWVGI